MLFVPIRPFWILVLFLTWGGGESWGQDGGGKASRAEIETHIEALMDADPGTRGEDWGKTVVAYQQALRLANETLSFSELAAEYRKGAAAAPEELAALPAVDPGLGKEIRRPPDAENAPLDSLLPKWETAKAMLAEARAAVQAHTEEETRRVERSGALPELIAKLKTELSALPVAAIPAAGSGLELAGGILTTAQKAHFESQIGALTAELEYYRASAELFAAQGGSAARKLVALGESVESWQRLIDRRRLESTGAAVAEAQENLDRFKDDPVGKEIALEIAELAAQSGAEEGLSQRLKTAGGKLSKLQAQVDRVTKQHAAARRRVKLLEDVDLRLDTTTGQLLRQQRMTLTPKNNLRSQLRSTLQESAQAQIDLITLEDRQVEVLAERIPEGEPEAILELRLARRDKIRTLVDDYRTYVTTLSSIVSNLRALDKETSEFALFVDQRLLWIPSTEPLGMGEFQIEAGAVSEVFSKDPFKTLREDFRERIVLWLVVAAFVIFLLARRGAYLKHLSTAGAAARKRNCTSFAPTAKAFSYTLLIALPFPALLWFVFARTGEMRPGIGEGVRNVAGFLTLTLLFWTITHPRGLMVDHFRMTESRVGLLRKNFRWFVPLMVVPVFFATVLPLKASADSAGRLFFLFLLLGLLVFFWRVLRPAKKLIHWRGKAPNRLAKVCFYLAVAASLALITGAAMGYYASVQELRLHALMSVWLIIASLFVTAMCHRWILVSRRRLAVQKALQRRAAALAERKTKEGDANATPQNVASPEEFKAEAIKVVEVEEQTARLVRAAAVAVIALGIWAIWLPMVPALSALDEVTLWSDLEVEKTAENSADTPAQPESNPIASMENSASNSGAAGEGSSKGKVTLQDLAGALIALLLTIVAAKNIPGLLELTVFRRLRFTPGTSFAFTTTFRYVIVVVGVVVAFGMVEITWGKVQWIAAAITLGIGFGLQEIFANFVAGLIILFERPIRLGDVITVGDVSGKVTQIRIRATTIRQFNNRELIVPNKEFITGQLVNWTLSDSVLRLEIPVGIAYGSDTEKAKAILLRVADENPKVAKEPAPDVLFDSFGDSALSFVLRGFVQSVDDLIAVRNELHFSVDHAFREAEIEIAFPQTDIHIRSLPQEAIPGGQPPAPAQS